MARRNAARCGVPALSHIEADLPAGLDELPAPDAIFIGGGLSSSVLRHCYDRLQPGGNLVAHAVTLESEALLLQGWQDYGGTLTRIAVNFADPVGGYHGWRPLMPVTQWHVTKPQM
jgi:precorrin-6Y C5,15-methyltransferase (decarboxylating)